MNIYVGNLSYGVTEEDLRQAFGAFGQVESVKIIKERFSGESKGFGFVEMPAVAEAWSAINGLSGTSLKGRALIKPKVRAQEREVKPWKFMKPTI